MTTIDSKADVHPRPLLKLAPVGAGAGINIVAPAASPQLERAEQGMKRMRALGYLPKLGHHAFQKGPLYFAGTPAQRLDDLHKAFADEQTKAVACLRGGYGSNYLLGKLDLELIRQHPKPFFAYSDLSGIQLHLLDELGLPGFHGPMVAADFSSEKGVHLSSLQAALSGTALPGWTRGGTARSEVWAALQRGARNAVWRLPEHPGFAAGDAV